MSDMKMYNILGKFNNVDPKMTPVKEDVKAEPVYENVEPRGSIMEAVASLEEKYMGFKKTVAAVKKGGSAENPEAVAAAIGRKKYGKKKFQKAAAAGKKLGEAAKPDYLDLDNDGDKEEAMKQAAREKEHEDRLSARLRRKGYSDEEQSHMGKLGEGEYDPAPIDPEAVAKRKRLQALKDKREEEGYGKDDVNTPIRKVAGKAYGGSAQHDAPEADDLDEVAPPGKKAERMVKHIKKGYAKDGKLTKREKGIAYATAWKAHNKGQVEEGKKVKLKESRVMEETDYFYEKIGRAIAEKNPTLDTASSEFNTAVRKEMIAHGIDPNRARNIMMMDDDFLSDVADSYHHCCQEIAECGAPMNSFVAGTEELDEIARLAGLPTKEAVYSETTDDERKLERYHELIKRGLDPDDAEVAVFNDEDDTEQDLMGEADMEEGNAFTGKLADTPAGGEFELDGKSFKDTSSLEEEEMEEGNEFSGALAKAKAAGAKEFEVDGKKYTVKESVTLMADGDDVVNLIRKLSGLETQEIVAPVAPVVPMGSEPSDEEAEEIAAQLQGEPAIEEERDIEHTNTPREEVAGIDAAIPAGADLNRAKKQYKKEYPGDNPMAVEESLWKSYEAMINDIKE